MKIFKIKLFVVFMVINNGEYVEFEANYQNKKDCEQMADYHNEKYGNRYKSYICEEVNHLILDKPEPPQKEG